MDRVRLSFFKRDRFCFIRHVELPEIFSRAARRADMDIKYTEGFSPHPKVTLGPPLPVGVPGLDEPVDIWFTHWDHTCLERFSAKLPPGLGINRAIEVEGKALSKLCDAGSYFITFPSEEKIKGFKDLVMSELFPDDVLLGFRDYEDGFILDLGDPGQYGPGKIVKLLIAREYIERWSDIRIGRLVLGKWDLESQKVLSLVGGEEELPLREETEL